MDIALNVVHYSQMPEITGLAQPPNQQFVFDPLPQNQQ